MKMEIGLRVGYNDTELATRADVQCLECYSKTFKIYHCRLVSEHYLAIECCKCGTLHAWITEGAFRDAGDGE